MNFFYHILSFLNIQRILCLPGHSSNSGHSIHILSYISMKWIVFDSFSFFVLNSFLCLRMSRSKLGFIFRIFSHTLLSMSIFHCEFAEMIVKLKRGGDEHSIEGKSEKDNWEIN